MISTAMMSGDGHDSGRYDAVWRRAEPYMRARRNDIHIPLSFAYAERLLEVYPAAQRDIVLLGILLHDIGWHAFDMADIVAKGFGPGKMKSELRRAHEQEGAGLARYILTELGWPPDVVGAVADIIDGHDTRDQATSLEDRLVRDADKLWRYTTVGVALSCDWFRKTPRDYAEQLETELVMIDTEAGRSMAAAALAQTRRELKLDLI